MRKKNIEAAGKHGGKPMMGESACLVCGGSATVQAYGYTFCDKHKRYAEIDPEGLESLVIWRFEGKSVQEIEKRLDKMLSVERDRLK